MPLKYNEITGEFEFVEELPEPEPQILLKPSLRNCREDDEIYAFSVLDDKRFISYIGEHTDGYSTSRMSSSILMHFVRIGRADIQIIENTEDGKPLGIFVGINSVVDYRRICTLYVHIDEEYRHKGVLTKCFPNMVEVLKNKRFNSIKMIVPHDAVALIKVVEDNVFSVWKNDEYRTYELKLESLHDEDTLLFKKLHISCMARNEAHSEEIYSLIYRNGSTKGASLYDSVNKEMGIMYYKLNKPDEARKYLNKIQSLTVKNSVSIELSNHS